MAYEITLRNAGIETKSGPTKPIARFDANLKKEGNFSVELNVGSKKYFISQEDASALRTAIQDLKSNTDVNITLRLNGKPIPGPITTSVSQLLDQLPKPSR